MCDSSAVNIVEPTFTRNQSILKLGSTLQLSSLQVRLLILSPERKATIFRDESWQCAAFLRSTPSGSINETSQQFSSPVLTARPSINRSEPSHNFSQLLALSLPVAAPQLAANFNVGNWHGAPQTSSGLKRVDLHSRRGRLLRIAAIALIHHPPEPRLCCPQLGIGGGSSLIRAVDRGFARAN